MKVQKMSFVMFGGILLLLLFFTLSFTGLRGKEGFGLQDDEDEDEDKEGLELQDDEDDEKKGFELQDDEDEDKEGFEGLYHLQPENSTSEKKMLDVFSQVEGKLSCGPISSQLHNSRGGLCLTADQQKLLQTRGGNSTSGESQIGMQ